MKRATIDVALFILVALSLLCNDNPGSYHRKVLANDFKGE